jgi:hypothetical protein
MPPAATFEELEKEIRAVSSALRTAYEDQVRATGDMSGFVVASIEQWAVLWGPASYLRG